MGKTNVRGTVRRTARGVTKVAPHQRAVPAKAGSSDAASHTDAAADAAAGGGRTRPVIDIDRAAFAAVIAAHDTLVRDTDVRVAVGDSERYIRGIPQQQMLGAAAWARHWAEAGEKLLRAHGRIPRETGAWTTLRDIARKAGTPAHDSATLIAVARAVADAAAAEAETRR